MLTRVGIQTKVETMPMNVYLGRASKLEFSFAMLGWGASTAESSSPLRSHLVTYDPAKGMGGFAWGRYSHPEVDRLTNLALATKDDHAREKLLQGSDGDCHQRPWHHPDPSPDQHLGDEKGHHLHSAYRRVHPGLLLSPEIRRISPAPLSAEAAAILMRGSASARRVRLQDPHTTRQRLPCELPSRLFVARAARTRGPAAGPGAVRRRPGTGLSEPPGAPDHAQCRRFQHRPAGAPDRPENGRQPGPAIRGRCPPRRQRHHRHGLPSPKKPGPTAIPWRWRCPPR